MGGSHHPLCNRMEFQMRYFLHCSAAIGVALMTGTSLAYAQTTEVIAEPSSSLVVAQEPVIVPPSGVLVAQPAQTIQAVPVQTVQTVETVQPAQPPKQRLVGSRVVRSRSGDRITTTRTTVRESVVAAPATSTEVVQVPAVMPPYQGLYNVVPPSAAIPAATATVVTQPVLGTAMVAPPAYRYVYQPDRILVIDANTGIAVQAIAR
jgi:hypothetical protein